MAETVTLDKIVVYGNTPEEELGPEKPFDFEGAMAEGWDKKSIVNHILETGQIAMDITAARKEGYSDDQIFEELQRRSEALKQKAYDLDNIEPGAPEDDYAELEQTAAVAEPYGGVIDERLSTRAQGDQWKPGIAGAGTVRDTLEQGGSSYAKKPVGLSPEITPQTKMLQQLDEQAAADVEASGLQGHVGKRVAQKEQYLGGMLHNFVTGNFDAKQEQALTEAAKELMSEGNIDGFDLHKRGGPVYFKKDSMGVMREYPLESSMVDSLAASKFELAASILVGAATKNPLYTAGAAALGATADAAVAGADAEQAVKTGATAGATDLVIGGTVLGLGHAADSLINSNKAKLGDSGYAGLIPNLSNEAQLYLSRHIGNPNITPQVVEAMLQGTKKEDQIYVLARHLDPEYVKQAVKDEDVLRAALKTDLARGRQKVLDAVGEVDVEGAMAKYADVKEHLRSTEGSVVRDASILKQAADAIVAKFRPQDTTTGAVQLVSDSGYGLAIRMQNLLANTNGKLSLSQAFEMRPEINSLLRKARDPLEKANLKLMKDSLDDFISTMATPEQKAMVDDAISTYARTMENRDTLEIINKFTKRNTAVNWAGLHRALNDAGLRSPEAVDALRIAETFSKKFGDDTQLATAAKAAGSSPDAGGALGAYGAFINFFKNHLSMWGNRSDNLKIQKAILNSLKNSKTNYDFVDNIRANKNIPDEFKGKDLEQAILQIEYKPGARTTGDVNLEPIVPPAGGTEQIVPKTEAASVQTPAASDLHKAFNDSGLVDIQKLDDEEFPEAFSFGGTIIPFKDTGKVVMLDSSGLKNGSSLGKDMYNKVWDALDKTGRLQRVDNLTEVNTIRFPINAYNRLLSKGSVPIEGGRGKLTDLVSSAIIKLNKELSSKGLPNLDRLTDEQIAKVGPILGADRNFRANVKTLELYKAAAQLLKHKRTLSTTALLPFLDAAYEEGE